MPRATVGDTSLTRSYIPKVSQTPGISPTIAHFYKPIKNRCIHEGRVVDQLYYTSDHIDCCFSNIRLNCLHEINEPIVPRFILDFYREVTLQKDDSGVILISFTLSLQQFGQILRIPINGQAVFTNEWDLGSLVYSQKTEGPYHIDLPTPKEIHQFLQFQRVDPNRKIKHKNVILSPNQVLTKELRQDLKRWNELKILTKDGNRTTHLIRMCFGDLYEEDHPGDQLSRSCLSPYIIYVFYAEHNNKNLGLYTLSKIMLQIFARATPKPHTYYMVYVLRHVPLSTLLESTILSP
ncbi:hypothetical protein Tco_0084100 [Tanacetum coccineum]